MPKWLKNIGWIEAAAGFLTGALLIIGLIYTSGQTNANTRRDINENTQHIEINERNIKINAERIEKTNNEIARQETTLARIEEGVAWIKKDLERK